MSVFEYLAYNKVGDLSPGCVPTLEVGERGGVQEMGKAKHVTVEHKEGAKSAKRIKSGEIHRCPAPAWERSLTLWCLAPLTNRDAGASQGCVTTQERCNDTKRVRQDLQKSVNGLPAIDSWGSGQGNGGKKVEVLD